MLSRRRVLGTVAAALPALALTPSCASTQQAAGGARPTDPPQPADLGTAEGWLQWIRAHRGNIALSIDDGRGHRLRYRATTAQPLASSVKVAHLAAYTRAVAGGRLDPGERVRIGDWERFYVPTDGYAHANALRSFNIPLDATGLFAADPERRIELDRMVAAMVDFSDSAVPDFLRERLGTDAVVEAAASGGWQDADIRSMCAEYLFLVLPEQAPAPGTPVPQRRAAGFRLEHRFSTDAGFRAQVLRQLTQLPAWDEQVAWGSGTAAATPSELASLHHSIATGTQRWATLARDHLERALSDHLPPGVEGIGTKGGSLPGVLTSGMYLRRADGSNASGALLAHHGITAEQLGKANPALPLLRALNDPKWRDRLTRALGPQASSTG